MQEFKNIQLEGRHGKSVTLDIQVKKDGRPKPVLIFIHGFKGFKDWGQWSLMGREIASNGYFFLRMNFSFNGTTPDEPSEFADLEAFGQNNFEKELDDVDLVLDWLFALDDGTIIPEADLTQIFLIGHSRGGPIAVIKAQEDKRIKGVITLASVHKLDYAWNDPALLDKWSSEGVYFILNGRTGQQMPLYFQLYENWKRHGKDYDNERAVKNLNKPYLILHGSDDPAVPFHSAELIHSWNPRSKLRIIEGADHVFGGKHPYVSNELPLHTNEIIRHILDFLDEKCN